MSYIGSRIITFATISLSLGVAATNATSAFAYQGQKQMAPRAAVHHQAVYERLVHGYAGPLHSVTEDCDLPSSACSNDERISN
jgi:acyl-CoA reductase-like NAD-dependent aldehyde dehydrogenase